VPTILIGSNNVTGIDRENARGYRNFDGYYIEIENNDYLHTNGYLGC
jgi:hypothetical protein